MVGDRSRSMDDMALRHRLTSALAAAFLAGAPPSSAEDPAEYTACMERARSKPAEGRAAALAWRNRGGGVPARHCLAVALFQLGEPEEAARQFEAAAEDSATPSIDLRAELYAQAAQAWLQAGRVPAAHRALSLAIDLRADDAELLVERAIVLGGAEKYWEAIDDLNRALDLARDNADAFVLRASAYRRVGSLDLAEEDIGRALALQANNVEGLLERGIIRRLRGDLARARADWIRVLQLRPDSPAGDVARANLEAADVDKR